MVKTTMRGSGLALVVGALLMGAAIAMVALRPSGQLPTPLVSTMLLVASILITLALPGMYARQSKAAGWLGLVGLVLTAVATLRAEVYPRWSGILMLAASAGFLFDFFVAEYLPPIAGQLGNAIFGMLFALAFAWIGVSIWMGLSQTAT